MSENTIRTTKITTKINNIYKSTTKINKTKKSQRELIKSQRKLKKQQQTRKIRNSFYNIDKKLIITL